MNEYEFLKQKTISLIKEAEVYLAGFHVYQIKHKSENGQIKMKETSCHYDKNSKDEDSRQNNY